jgi:hypothetical protein
MAILRKGIRLIDDEAVLVGEDSFLSHDLCELTRECGIQGHRRKRKGFDLVLD